MNKAPKWLYVILISSVQLVLLLVVVVALFGWMETMTGTMLGQQTCLDNHKIAKDVASSITANSIRDVRSTKAQDLEKLNGVLRQVQLPEAGIVCVFDFGTAQILSFHSTDQSPPPFESMQQVQCLPLDNDASVNPLTELISNQTGKRHTSGRAVLKEQEYFVSARFLPQLNAVLLVAQQRSLATSGLAGTIKQSKNYAFACTLLIGLVGICLTAFMVSRIGEAMKNLNFGLEQVVSNSEQELVRTKNAVIFGLAKLAESRDNDTGEHLDRIRIYVTILAQELASTHTEFDAEYIHNLVLASSLHDIGKVGIPDSILLKPGRLTPEERGIMEIHTLIGGECLDAIHARLGENEFMDIARQIAYYHHERWDGTGYPHSLKGSAIPLVARIVAVADVYDALTSKRPYKKAMTHAESREIIVSGSGQHFDPQVVEAFLRHEDKFEEVSLQQQFISDDDATSGFQRLYEAAQAPQLA